MAESKVWFITGASSGFGRGMTEHLLSKGHKVVATLRKPEVLANLVSQYSSGSLVVVKVDVTKHDEIVGAFEKAREAFGRLDVVFNNAGKMINGEVESISDADARELIETNFWGAAHVTREAVRFLRDVNKPQGGRILQVSSGMALISLPTYGFYSASKFALDGMTEALVQELDPAWNIKVTTLNVGPFLTSLWKENKKIVPAHDAYKDPELEGNKSRALIDSAVIANGDPKKACIAFEKVSELDDPPPRLLLHKLVLGMAAGKAKSLLDTAEKYKEWSDDLYL